MTELIVRRPGARAIVVDRGRFGHRHEGVAWCGPADSLAYDAANVLLVNDTDCASVEFLLGDALIEFTGPVAFALTGADCAATLDGERCATWAKHVARAGSQLRLLIPKHGVYTYLAISGGLDVPAVLGSRTTDVLAGIGGWRGRPLRTDDVLASNAACIPPREPFAVAPPQRHVFAHDGSPDCATVRITSGGEFESFAPESQHAFFDEAWRVSINSNRMGNRLQGKALRYTGPELASHAVFPGVIQVPPSGEPIVLLCDAHTTGGYPKAGVVIDTDLSLVAQCRPGDSIRFTRVDEAEARAAAAARRGYLEALARIALERSGR